MNAVEEARTLLQDLTPLRRDCGKLCGARCCRSLEGEETGMLLFPGEEDTYEDREGWRMIPAEEGLLLICPGNCERQERPLACRLFPLLPEIREGEIRVRTDERARAVCPLAKAGVRGLDPDFVQAVRDAGEILSNDPEQKAFLDRLAGEQEELRRLRRKLTGRG